MSAIINKMRFRIANDETEVIPCYCSTNSYSTVYTGFVAENFNDTKKFYQICVVEA